jgi:SAM-dependent methyltransferase
MPEIGESIGQDGLRFIALEACPCCGSRERLAQFSSPDFLVGVPGVFNYVACSSCRTVFQQPQVSQADLHRCYPASYFTHSRPSVSGTLVGEGRIRHAVREGVLLAADGGRNKGLPLAMRLVGRLLAQIPNVRRRARLGLLDGLGLPRGDSRRCLEVGPGQGVELRQLSALGWDAVGLERDPAAASVAREASGCQVQVGTLEDQTFTPGSFDLIYMNHVLEHLPDPQLALLKSRELLGDDGRLVLVYPNPESLSARIYGKHAWIWDPPRHLVLPSRDAIGALLQRLRYVDVCTFTIARRAAHSRHMARRYRAHGPGAGLGEERLRITDRIFGLTESFLLQLGLSVGEEVVVLAKRSSATRAA